MSSNSTQKSFLIFSVLFCGILLRRDGSGSWGTWTGNIAAGSAANLMGQPVETLTES